MYKSDTKKLKATNIAMMREKSIVRKIKKYIYAGITKKSLGLVTLMIRVGLKIKTFGLSH